MAHFSLYPALRGFISFTTPCGDEPFWQHFLTWYFFKLFELYHILDMNLPHNPTSQEKIYEEVSSQVTHLWNYIQQESQLASCRAVFFEEWVTTRFLFVIKYFIYRREYMMVTYKGVWYMGVLWYRKWRWIHCNTFIIIFLWGAVNVEEMILVSPYAW